MVDSSRSRIGTVLAGKYRLDREIGKGGMGAVYRAFHLKVHKEFAVKLLLNEAAQKSPIGELVDIMDVGFTCAYLATPFARRVTGGTVYVDGGANIIA